MRGANRARRLTVAIAAPSMLLAVAFSAGCADSKGSKEKFCEELPDTQDVLSILSDFESSTSAAMEKRFSEGLDEYRSLERAAPREIRADVAALGDAVERILEVVQKHPDDLAAIRAELGEQASSFVSAGKAADRVGRYAQANCDIDLGGGATTDPTPSSDGSVTSTTG